MRSWRSFRSARSGPYTSTLLTPADSASKGQTGPLQLHTSTAPTIDLLFQLALRSGFVDHILEYWRAVLAPRAARSREVIGVDIAEICLLQNSHPGLLRDAGDQLVGDGAQQGL